MKVSSTFAASLLLALSLIPLQDSSAQNTSAPLRWTEGAPNATSEVRNDNKIEGLKADDFHIFVSLADVKETDYNRVWVQISNHGKAPIQVDPQTAMLVNRQKDKTVPAEAPDKVANAIQKKGEAKSQEMSSANCNMMNSGGSAHGGAHGTPSGGGAGSGCQPTDTSVQVGKQIATFTAQQAQWVRDNAFKQQAIAPDQEAQGAILFKKDKKPADYILRIPVGDQMVEFPVSATNKPPSYD